MRRMWGLELRNQFGGGLDQDACRVARGHGIQWYSKHWSQPQPLRTGEPLSRGAYLHLCHQQVCHPRRAALSVRRRSYRARRNRFLRIILLRQRQWIADALFRQCDGRASRAQRAGTVKRPGYRNIFSGWHLVHIPRRISQWRYRVPRGVLLAARRGLVRDNVYGQGEAQHVTGEPSVAVAPSGLGNEVGGAPRRDGRAHECGLPRYVCFAACVIGAMELSLRLPPCRAAFGGRAGELRSAGGEGCVARRSDRSPPA